MLTSTPSHDQSRQTSLASPPARPSLDRRRPALLPFVEGAGSVVNDFSGNGHNGSFVGSPAWQSGPLGTQLGGFDASDYAVGTFSAPIITNTGPFPFWMASVISITTISNYNNVIQVGNSATDSYIGIFLTYTYSIQYFNANDANTGQVLCGANPSNVYDGFPHLIWIASYSPSSHQIGWDGQVVATSTAALETGTTTTNQWGVGTRLNETNQVFRGSILWAAAGSGTVPDFAALAADPFAHLRKRRRTIFAPTSTAINLTVPAAHAAWVASSPAEVRALPAPFRRGRGCNQSDDRPGSGRADRPARRGTLRRGRPDDQHGGPVADGPAGRSRRASDRPGGDHHRSGEPPGASGTRLMRRPGTEHRAGHLHYDLAA